MTAVHMGLDLWVVRYFSEISMNHGSCIGGGVGGARDNWWEETPLVSWCMKEDKQRIHIGWWREYDVISLL